MLMVQLQENTDQSNASIEGSIALGFEKIYEAYKYLLFKEAEKENISSLQLQILRVLRQRGTCRLSDIARALQLSKPTLSDALKMLISKGLVLKTPQVTDRRNANLSLSEEGLLLTRSLYVLNHLAALLCRFPTKDKDKLQSLLMQIIEVLQAEGIVSVNKMCYTCTNYQGNKKDAHFCKLLNRKLQVREVKLHCAEHNALL
jgi:DNA-binding MarR family transcriptional regulator